MSRTIHAFSSFSSMATSSRRVRTARTPVAAMPRTSPTMLVASRITEAPSATRGRGEEADERAHAGGDADRAPRVAAHVLVGRRHGVLRPVLHRGLDLAELLPRRVVLRAHLRLHLVHLRSALVLHGLEQVLGFGNDVLHITPDGVGLGTAAALHGDLLSVRLRIAGLLGGEADVVLHRLHAARAARD